jgi:transposase InsO family protein
LESNIFSHFGLPLEIVSNNGPTFISSKFTQFISKFGVKQFTSTTYYPQRNGQIESTNKNLIKILKKIIDDKPRQWHRLLIYVLCTNKTTTKFNIVHTPFHLLYGQETIMLVELELTSLRLALHVG